MAQCAIRFLAVTHFAFFSNEIHLPGKFYKGRSQEKTLLRWLEFFLLRSPPDRARCVLTYRAMCSVAGHGVPVVWVFSTSGFHRFLATKPVCSETNQAERSSIWRPWFYPGLVAHSFFWLSERA
jgi:hypothetical protein